MDEDVLIDFKNLRLYYKFASKSSSTQFFMNGTRTVQFNAEEFYASNISDKTNFRLMDELATSRKKLLKTTKDYLDMAKIIDGLNLTIHQGEDVSIVGETGCGKTTLLMSLLNLRQEELGYMRGEILYNYKGNMVDLLQLPEDEMREIRGLEFGLVPQLGRASLDPFLRVGYQTGEILKERLSENQEYIKSKVIEYFGRLAFPKPNTKIDKFVHELSGGEAQRVCIAMALISGPKVLLGDEIFSALDTINQASLMDLLKDIKQHLPFQYILATHNIQAACTLTQTIAVMYAGQIVEVTPAKKFLEEPLHPFSQGLLKALPWYAFKHNVELESIEGDAPLPYVWPTGCRFSPRCKRATAKCNQEAPPIFTVGEVKVACWLYSEE